MVVVQGTGIARRADDGCTAAGRLPARLQRMVQTQGMVLVEGVAHRRVGRLVVQYWHPHQTLGRVGHVGRLQFGGQLPFPLVPAVLKPDFDLGLGQVEAGRQAGPFGRRQVPLHVERRLQLEHLRSGEHRSGFLFPFVRQRTARTQAGAVHFLVLVVVVVALVVLDLLVDDHVLRVPVRGLGSHVGLVQERGMGGGQAAVVRGAAGRRSLVVRWG